MTTVFIGTNEQLINCLTLAANTRNCPSVHAGAMIAAAERLAKAEAERDAAVAMNGLLDAARDMLIADGERRATAAIVQLADALEWALREIDGENEYRKGHRQIQCRQNAERVLALWKCGGSGKVNATTSKTAEYERAIVGEGMRRERKAVVKWLQSDASQLGFLGFQASNAIERGDHITKGKP